MVVIITIGTPNVKGHLRRLRKALQSMRDHLRAQVPDLLSLEAQVDDRPRPAGEVDYGPGKRFVEGCVAASEAGERLARAEGAGECCAEGEEGVFCCVVVVDWNLSMEGLK